MAHRKLIHKLTAAQVILCGFFILKQMLQNEILALIAPGMRGIASFGRREGSQCSPQGVFAAAKLRQKRKDNIKMYIARQSEKGEIT